MATYTSPEDENFFGAVGRLVISWGHLEFSLDCMVEIIHIGFGGAEIEPEIPRTLQRKIRFLRTAFKRMPLPQDAIQGYTALFGDIEAAAQTRHDIVHGIVIEHIEQSGEATMVRALRNKRGVEKRENKFTTKDILDAAVNVQRLSSKTFYWLEECHKVLHELQNKHAERTS